MGEESKEIEVPLEDWRALQDELRQLRYELDMARAEAETEAIRRGAAERVAEIRGETIATLQGALEQSNAALEDLARGPRRRRSIAEGVR